MDRRRISAVVLAGTHQWSGSTFETLAPRPLLPVALAPLISYPLRWLREAGIRQATICVNGSTRAIEAAFGDGSGLDMELTYYNDGTPRGAAGCVRDAGLATTSEAFVVTGATAIPTVFLEDLLASHEASGAAMSAVVHREPPSGAPSPGGVYVTERRVLDRISDHGFQDIKENLIPALRKAGERVVAYETESFCPHVLDARTYLAVNEWVLQQLAQNEGAENLVEPSAAIHPSARLVGPVQIGPGARVDAGVTIVGPTSIGAGCTVGRNGLVARSVLWSRCVLAEDVTVHGCVLGNDAVVPPRSRLFNVVRSPEPVRTRPLRLPLPGQPSAGVSAAIHADVLRGRRTGPFLRRSPAHGGLDTVAVRSGQ